MDVKNSRLSDYFLGNTIQIGCRNKSLGLTMDEIEQGCLAVLVQFAHHVVQKQNRLFSRQLLDQLDFRQFQAEGNGPLLPLGGKQVCILAVQLEFKVIAVGAKLGRGPSELIVSDRRKAVQQLLLDLGRLVFIRNFLG